MRFTFKNQQYDKNQQYYLVVDDEATGTERFRHPVIMDLAFFYNNAEDAVYMALLSFADIVKIYDLCVTLFASSDSMEPACYRGVF